MEKIEENNKQTISPTLFTDKTLATQLGLPEFGGEMMVKDLKRCFLGSPQATGKNLKLGEELKKVHFLNPNTEQIEEATIPEIIKIVGHPWEAILPIKKAADLEPEKCKDDWIWLKTHCFTFCHPETAK